MRLPAVSAALILSYIRLVAGQANARNSPDHCRQYIGNARDQIASGNFSAYEATKGTLKAMRCRADRAACADIAGYMFDVINSETEDWHERAERYLELATVIGCVS
jgi:hypothetical protein